MSNQSLRQASVRALTGTSGTYEEDWMALFDQDGIQSGTFNERLYAWLAGKTGLAGRTIDELMHAYAVSQGVSNWGALGTIVFGAQIGVPKGDLFLSAFAPTISISGFKMASPLAGNLLFSRFAPTASVTAGASPQFTIPGANLLLAGVAPTVVHNAIPAVIYDGVQGYMLHTGGPTGAADGAAFSFAWAGTFNSDGSAMTLLDIPGTVPVKITRQSDNTIDFVGGTTGAVFSNSTTAVAASLGFLIILASCNGTSSTLKVVHAAGTITGTNIAGSATNLDLTADWFLGADGGAAEFLDADTALWWANAAEIDFSDSDNIEQFWDTTNDLLRDPGSDGSNPTDGTQPLVCHKSPAATHTANAGSGGDADTAGTFTDGTSPGTYAADQPSGYIAVAASFDGTNDYVTYGGASGKLVDSKQLTMSVWLRFSTPGANMVVFCVHADAGAIRFGVLPTSTPGSIIIQGRNISGVTILQQVITDFPVDAWGHLLVSFDLATSTFQAYVNDVVATVTNTTLTDANIDFNPASTGDISIGAFNAGNNKYTGFMADLWVDVQVAMDISVEANRRKFIDATGKPVDLGSDGSTPTGSQIEFTHSGAIASWHTNKGFITGSTEVGDITEAANSPSD